MNRKTPFSTNFSGVNKQRQLFTTNYLRKNSIQTTPQPELRTNLSHGVEMKKKSIHQRLGFQTNRKQSLDSSRTNGVSVKARLGYNRLLVTNSNVTYKNGIMTKKKLQAPTIQKDVIKMNILKNLEQNKKANNTLMLTKPKIAVVKEMIKSSNLVVTPRHNIKEHLNPKLQEEIRKLQYKIDFSTPLTLGYTGRTLNDRFSNL